MMPAETSSKPAIMRRVVVLPQPDGPSREKNWPRAMLSDRSSTATTSWKRLVTRSRRMSGGVMLVSSNAREVSPRPALDAATGRRVAGEALRDVDRDDADDDEHERHDVDDGLLARRLDGGVDPHWDRLCPGPG